MNRITHHDGEPHDRRHRRHFLADTAIAAAAALSLPWPLLAQAQTAAAPNDGATPSESQAPALPAVGTRLALPPAIELLDGQRFDAATADGRVLLLYWWASWCPFCALTSPHVDRLWQAQRQRPAGQGLLFLPLSIDRRPEDARAYLQKRGYAWPAAWVSPALHRVLPKPKGLPVSIVRGRDGKVLQVEAGQLFPEDVEGFARHAA